MKKAFYIRLYEKGDEKGIVELLNHAFDRWPKFDMGCDSLEHWTWKYLDNPLGIQVIGVGVSDNTIIGCFHIIPLRIKIGDKIILGITGTDLAVHNDYRRMGVSTEIRDLCREQYPLLGIKYVFFIIGNPFLVKSYKKIRPSFPHNIIDLVRIHDINEHLTMIPVKNSWLKKNAYKIVKTVNRIRNRLNIVKLNQNIIITEINNFSEDIDKFWESVSMNYDFILDRRKEYLNWRYCDIRSGGFVVKLAKEDAETLGYCVLRINRYLENYPIGYIVDFLILPGRLDAAEKLASDAVKYFDDAGVNIINYLVAKGHPHEEVFRKLGFLDSRVKIHLFYNTFALGRIEMEEIDKLRKSPHSKIHISWGDLDVLPISPSG